MRQAINWTNDALLLKNLKNIKCDPLLENVYFKYCQKEHFLCDQGLMVPLLKCATEKSY